MRAGIPIQAMRSIHHAVVPLVSRPRPSGHKASTASRNAVMCQRNRVMMMLLAKIVAFQGLGFWSQRPSRSRSNMTAPIVQIPTAR